MKVFVLFISIVFSFSIATTAQTDKIAPGSLIEQAQKSLNDGKFTEARYFYKKAYEGFAAQRNYSQAIECGLKTNSLFVREYIFKEALELCRSMDALIGDGEEKENRKFYDLRLLVAKDRLQLYIKMKNTQRAREQLSVMDEIDNLANNDSISEDILYTKANYYYLFGPIELGTNCYMKLIDQHKQKGDLQKATDCYNSMIDLAEKVNNAPLAISIYKQYIAWTDSVKSLTAANELAEMKQKYEDSQSLLQEKESGLSSKQYLIIMLCILSGILIIVLIIVILILLRFVWLSRRQKKNIEITSEHNQLKSHFIQNISAQMAPALNTLAKTIENLSGEKEQLEKMQTQIDSLKNFSSNIQELSTLENSLDELYVLKNCYVNTFCEEVMNKISPFVNLGVETQVNAFKLQAKINPEHLERILVHLLKNAALFTKSGKITLEFRKKGAHIQQFIVTDTGQGIPEELKENLFKPFTEIKDLSQGDGLGLPICSLIAIKMNGNITLDTSYKRGSQFVIELRT